MRTGEDNGDGRGEGAALLQSAPAGEEGTRSIPPAAPEKPFRPGRSASRRAARPGAFFLRQKHPSIGFSLPVEGCFCHKAARRGQDHFSGQHEPGHRRHPGHAAGDGAAAGGGASRWRAAFGSLRRPEDPVVEDAAARSSLRTTRARGQPSVFDRSVMRNRPGSSLLPVPREETMGTPR